MSLGGARGPRAGAAVAEQLRSLAEGVGGSRREARAAGAAGLRRPALGYNGLLLRRILRHALRRADSPGPGLPSG